MVIATRRCRAKRARQVAGFPKTGVVSWDAAYWLTAAAVAMVKARVGKQPCNSTSRRDSSRRSLASGAAGTGGLKSSSTRRYRLYPALARPPPLLNWQAQLTPRLSCNLRTCGRSLSQPSSRAKRITSSGAGLARSRESLSWSRLQSCSCGIDEGAASNEALRFRPGDPASAVGRGCSTWGRCASSRRSCSPCAGMLSRSLRS